MKNTAAQWMRLVVIWMLVAGCFAEPAAAVRFTATPTSPLTLTPTFTATPTFTQTPSATATTPVQTETDTTTPSVTVTPTNTPPVVIGTWTQDGDTLNRDSNVSAGSGIVRLGPGDQPYVAMTENDNGYAQVYVKRLTSGNWETLGGPVNNDPAQNVNPAGFDVRASGSGNPYVAFLERVSGGSYPYVFAKHWNGSAWQQLGGSLNLAQNAVSADLAVDSQDRPYVAWTEYDYPGNQGPQIALYVKRWNGAAWEQLGGDISTDPLRGDAQAPRIVIYNDQPWVVWAENLYGNRIYLKHWNGSAWEDVLGPSGAQNVGNPRLAIDAEGSLYASWQDFYANTPHVVKYANGNWWQLADFQGNYVDEPWIYALPANNNLELAGGRNTVYVSWSSNDANGHSHAYVSHFDGEHWIYDGWDVGAANGTDRTSGSLRLASSGAPYMALSVQDNGNGVWRNYVQHHLLATYATPTITPTGTISPTTSTFTPVVTAPPTLTPYVGPYLETWSDDFQNGTPETVPVKWVVSQGNFHADMRNTNVTSYAAVTRYDGYGPSTWGKVLTQPLTIDTSLYRQVTVSIAQVAPATGWKVLVQIPANQVSISEQEFTELCSTQNGTGTYTFNYADARKWTGNHQFFFVLVVEGGTASSIVVDSLSVHTMQYGPTPTMTPTPDQTNGWQEHFLGAPGASVGGWIDTTVDTSCNATLQYSYTESQGIITRAGDAAWGKVLSPSLELDTDIYTRLEINVAKLSPSVTWKMGIQETEGAWRYWDLSASSNSTGTFAWDYAQIAGMTGVKHFAVQIVLEGGAGEFAEIGHLRIYKTGVPYTQTVTPTATITPTVIVTPTATATPTTTTDIWADDFEGTPGEQPQGWDVEPAYNAELAYANSGHTATLIRANSGTWGKALSPSIQCDVDAYPCVEVHVVTMTAQVSWKVGIQEINGNWQYWDVCASSGALGVFQFDYAGVTGWTGIHDFQVQLTVEGPLGKSVEFDWVRVCMAGSVRAASAGPLRYCKTPTPSRTPTASPSITATPVQPRAAATATPSMTATATPRPWLNPGQVRAYPNPSHDRVNFSYTLNGSGKVAIDIYKVSGERVAHIVEQRDGGPGQTLTTAWEATGVAPGIYFCRVVVTDGSGREVMNVRKKVAIVK